MGMDRGIHVVMNDKEYSAMEPLAVAKLFAKIVEQEKADIVMLGKQVRMIDSKFFNGRSSDKKYLPG